MGYDCMEENLFIGADTINLRVFNNNGSLQMDVFHQTSNGWFRREISCTKVAEETKSQAHSPAELKNFIVLAIKKNPGFNATIEPVTEEDESGQTVTRGVLLKLSYKPPHALQPKVFELTLEPLPVSVEHRLDLLERTVEPHTCDRFSGTPGEIHSALSAFNDRRMITKKRDAPQSQHLSASTGVSFSRGRHFIVFRIIRSTNNHCMIGIQHQLGALTPHPGHATFPTGKALNGNNGHLYANGSNTNYNIGGFGVGDYVGVLLDMDRKKLSFSINGFFGDEVDVSEPNYFFVVNMYTNLDAVKIVPRYCWHNKY